MDYIFTVKGNQPTLHDALRGLFERALDGGALVLADVVGEPSLAVFTLANQIGFSAARQSIAFS